MSELNSSDSRATKGVGCYDNVGSYTVKFLYSTLRRVDYYDGEECLHPRGSRLRDFRPLSLCIYGLCLYRLPRGVPSFLLPVTVVSLVTRPVTEKN